MAQFLFIFLLTLLAFSHSYLLLYMNHEGVVVEEQVQVSELKTFSAAFIFTYSIVFGEYNFDDFNIYAPWLLYLFFILQTMFIVVVMLNLLISIIGNTFDKVKTSKECIVYQDMVDMILENEFLLSWPNFGAPRKQAKYLVLVLPEDKEQGETEMIEKQFFQLKQTLRQIQKRQVDRENYMEGVMKRLTEKVAMMEEQ
eukprot:CAMPEP_0202966310 /NCGR_PEP_ID=MMETSP1396-20130829/10673_1 /ASSEMBLY_ACC=CAM_ASM_000872 /TAXON_ID= /ORGANISM="Pseudokeronopsis sp., Strain Brazil" /LENGTH=197 /DNA_ID=CAMNT_0049690017 /DNA_START=1765 /DNA_END=2358 /DNA_ORIENTATION=-